MQIKYRNNKDMSILSTDLRPDSPETNFIIILVKKDGKIDVLNDFGNLTGLQGNLIMAEETKEIILRDNGVYRGDDGKYHFVPLSEDQIVSLEKANIKFRREGVNNGEPWEEKVVDFKRDPDTVRYYLRPALDPLFEKLVFGLSVKGGIDMLRLKDMFPSQKFDYVFSETLNPYLAEQSEEVCQSVEDVLQMPGGVARMEFEGVNGGTLVKDINKQDKLL
jgi:hypothetical protein